MNPYSIFFPSLTLMIFTYLALVQIPWRRFRAYFRHEVGPEDFKCSESGKVPESVVIPNRVFMNLLEMPVMFYAVSVMIYVADKTDGTFIVLAWMYVALRIVHAVIFLTSNHILSRFLTFAISNVLLLLALIRFAVLIAA
ncbi:MAG: MAPEG family protein [Azoarcus sp.]|jgi:hypothetical protein|nr:MAPEG family protein [Azoarcus sp.]